MNYLKQKKPIINRRKNLKSDFPGRFLSSIDHSYISAVPIDVSVDGIGVVCRHSIPEGSYVWLFVNDQSIKFEVVYCKPDYDHRAYFRCGLRSLDRVNLEVLFHQLGVFQ